MSHTYEWSDIKVSFEGRRLEIIGVTTHSAKAGETVDVESGAYTVKCDLTSSVSRRDWDRMWAMGEPEFRGSYLSRHKRKRVRKRLLSRLVSASNRKAKRYKGRHRSCYNEHTLTCDSYVMNGNVLCLSGARFE